MLNRLEMLRIFCTAAETGSFKGAAAKLGTSPQAVTRAIQELEALQGELLFHRNTRGIRITAFGEQLARRAREGVQQIDVLFAQESAPSEADLQGVVSLTAPNAFGRHHLMPILTRIAKDHPQIAFNLRFNDQRLDVVDEKIDIGLRMGFIRDNRFVVRPVAKMPFCVVAAPELLARQGVPSAIEDLDRFPLSAMHDRTTGRLWPWFFKAGQQLTPQRPAFVCDDAEVECSALLAGIAIGQVPGFMAMPHIAAGRLVEVLQRFAPDPWDLYIYRPQRTPTPARIRLVFDTLTQALSVDQIPEDKARWRDWT
ncbi:LysR family transcriptional regulator [Propionivibrio dicarboxylicus]|uniref:DNA-binding transcriptional regulator, LysR family n=1 Tax=Propionivibrio dicarboxylicus TaxID=83767 RepID=A0A1G8IWD1_9RHOO|nr:LysR family transcriptional regulator [Propionivibrio dicarboxylicus]SDI23241.1 DNA-binding transcriptional regulator, LysR family [Propionivibrio dicarboxylicus]